MSKQYWLIRTLAWVLPAFSMACGGVSNKDRDGGTANKDESGVGAVASSRPDANAAPERSAPTATTASATPSAAKLTMKIDGESVEVKRAYAYSDGDSRIMLLLTNNAGMNCETYFAPGRGFGPEERTVFVWMAPSSGASWSVSSVMVKSSSRNGDGLGTVRSMRGSSSDTVHADLAIATEITAPPHMKMKAIKLDIDGPVVAKGCGKNPAQL